jgi:hypothetical protein
VRRWAGGDATGRLGQAATLGCNEENGKRVAVRASQDEEMEGHRQTSALRAAHEVGPEEGKAEGKEKRGLTILKRAQANEFKFEFEFKQPKAMHQH